MMKLKLTLIVALLAFPASASAHLVTKPKDDTRAAIHASQTENLKHVRYVCRNGKGVTKRWHCSQMKWLEREARETAPIVVRSWGPWAFRDSCLREISRRETAGTFDPGIWNYQGSGAFGLGQALPYSKMPKAAWPKEYGGQEDPWVQMRWMEGYVDGRYGGSCAALEFHNANGWY
jgi:hypothetical protein